MVFGNIYVMTACNLFTHRAPQRSQQLIQKCLCIPRSNWNLEMFLLRRGENQTTRKKNLSENSREPTTNSTHIWRWVRYSSPGHFGGRRALSRLCHPKLTLEKKQDDTKTALDKNFKKMMTKWLNYKREKYQLSFRWPQQERFTPRSLFTVLEYKFNTWISFTRKWIRKYRGSAWTFLNIQLGYHEASSVQILVHRSGKRKENRRAWPILSRLWADSFFGSPTQKYKCPDV